MASNIGFSLVVRLLTYRLTPENREKGKETVRQILVNNKYDPLPITLEHKKKKRNHNTQTQKREINDKLTTRENPVFQAILKHDPQRDTQHHHYRTPL